MEPIRFKGPAAYIADLDRSRAFYEGLLGLTVLRVMSRGEIPIAVEFARLPPEQKVGFFRVARMGGKGTVTAVARFIWAHHEPDLRSSGDLFYTWQYDMRWAATVLRKGSVMRKNDRDEPWELQ